MSHIYVINLRRSTVRRRLMERQLRRLGLAFDFIEARDATSITANPASEIISSVARGGALTPGELACAHSHSDACSVLAEQVGDEYGVVMEDDVILGQNLTKVISALEKRGPRDEVVLLGGLAFRPIDLIGDQPLIGPYILARPTPLERVWGAQAYFVSRKQARTLADATLRLQCRADDWWSYVQGGVVGGVHAVFPFPVVHAELNSDVQKYATDRYVFSRQSISRYIHAHRVFPFQQLSLLIRRNRAEHRQRCMITLNSFPVSVTYRL